MKLPAVKPIVGKRYYRRSNHPISRVVEVVSVCDGQVVGKAIHGPRYFKSEPYLCKEKNFRWFPCPDDMTDYTQLDGCKIYPTFVVLTTNGDPIFRCSSKRASFYLRKGYAKQIDDDTLQLTDATTEKTLERIYKGDFSEFFLEVKNDKCACCGKPHGLSRHHVVPKRHKDKIPLHWRRCISNILFLCLECHLEYEKAPEPEIECDEDWECYICAWKDHFVKTMSPEHLPNGWDIITVKDLKEVMEECD